MATDPVVSLDSVANLRTSLLATRVVCRAVQKGLSLQELSNVGDAGGWQKVTRREKLFVRFQERLKWRG